MRATIDCVLLAAAALIPTALHASAPAGSTPPPPSAFRTADGAYLTTVGGHVVDPYFVNKALIIALESGLDASAEVTAWLRWLLPRQRADGGFDRFCTAGHTPASGPVKALPPPPPGSKAPWWACMPADADDSMTATVIHLITLARQQSLLPPDLRPRADRAQRQARQLLGQLLDTDKGLYRVFADQPLYYLMDNAEVHAALRVAGEARAARQLAQAMQRQFVQGGRWQPAIPAYDSASFYPHTLAHSYLWDGQIIDRTAAASEMAGWLAQHSRRWLRRESDRFAWGLVAWNIAPLAPAEAGCWRRSVHPLPEGVGWTVLDAFVDQALAHRGIAITCTRVP